MIAILALFVTPANAGIVSNFVSAHPDFFENHPGLAAHVDLDGDGFSGSVDCDDRDPSVNPDALDEPFDGIDQDCDDVLNCEFEVEQADGSFVTMPNEVVTELSEYSPAGVQRIWPDSQEALIFNLNVVHPQCPSIFWAFGLAEFDFTDNNQSGYEPHDVLVYDLTIDFTQPISGPYQLDLLDRGPMVQYVEIEGGDTHTFEVAANFTGASSPLNDEVTVNIDGATMLWTSMGATSTINDYVDGFRISF